MKRSAGMLHSGRTLEHIQVDCSWCDADVPLPAGDAVGVCIVCGAVVFRDHEARSRAERRNITRSNHEIPTPA